MSFASCSCSLSLSSNMSASEALLVLPSADVLPAVLFSFSSPFFILRPIRLRKPHHFVPFLFLFLGATEARFSVKDYVDMPSSALFGELGRVDIFVSSDASSQPRYRFCRPDFTYL